MRYQGQLRAYRRLSVQECDLDATRECQQGLAHPGKVIDCIAPARPKRLSHTGAARAAWYQLLEAMEPWMHLPPSEIQRLKEGQEDDETWTLQPPPQIHRESISYKWRSKSSPSRQRTSHELSLFSPSTPRTRHSCRPCGNGCVLEHPPDVDDTSHACSELS